MSPNQNTGCKSRFFSRFTHFSAFYRTFVPNKHAHDHYRRFQRPGAFRADARRSPRQGIRDAHRNPEAHHPPPAHKTQRHHRAIADRHGQNRGYGLPILQTLEPARGPIQAIILVPTRELALQAAEELLSYNREKRLSITAIYGGAAMSEQLRRLAKASTSSSGHRGACSTTSAAAR